MENNNNQAENGGKQNMDQNKDLQSGSGSEQAANFDNPQEGKKWDNYQTRTLSEDYDEKTAGTSEADVRTAFENQKNNDSKDE